MFIYTTCRRCGGLLHVTDNCTVHPGCEPKPTKVERLNEKWADAIAAGDQTLADSIEDDIIEYDAQPPRLLGAALRYAAWRWPVFPLKPCSKQPATRNGFKDATTDTTRIRAWWERHPDSNIGLPTGHAFDVIDIDVPDGPPSFAQLIADDLVPDVHGQVATSSGGLHLYIPPTGDGNGVRIVAGIDYRGLGGYVVALRRRSPGVGVPGHGSPRRRPSSPGRATPMQDDGLTFMQRVAARNPRPDGAAAPAPVINGHHPEPDHPLVRAALNKRLAELAAMAPRSGRNDALNAAAGYLGRFPIDRDQLRAMLLDACRANGVHEEDGRAACDGTISSGFKEADRQGPRVIEDRGNGRVTEVNGTELGAHVATGREIRWTRGDQINTGVPVWAWSYGGRGRIQLGTLALFAGRPAAGKSTAARWFAAQATLGRLEGCWDGQPQHVAYIAAEESARYTIGPGLLAAGADMTRIHFPAVYHDGQAAQLLSILDEAAITDYCRQLNITVVIVDPLMSTITGAADINKNNEVRAQLAPWTRIADCIDGITLGVAHLRKSGTGDVVAAVTGSSAFGELARSVFGFAKNHEDDTRVMSQHKNSTGYEDLSVTYVIESETVKVASGETAEVGKFTITGDSQITVEDILSDSTMFNGANLECQRWLEDYLTQLGAAPSKEVKAEAHKELGVSATSVERAAKKLRVLIDSRGFPRRTYWMLPETVASADPGQSRQQSRHE